MGHFSHVSSGLPVYSDVFRICHGSGRTAWGGARRVENDLAVIAVSSIRGGRIRSRGAKRPQRNTNRICGTILKANGTVKLGGLSEPSTRSRNRATAAGRHRTHFSFHPRVRTIFKEVLPAVNAATGENRIRGEASNSAAGTSSTGQRDAREHEPCCAREGRKESSGADGRREAGGIGIGNNCRERFIPHHIYQSRRAGKVVDPQEVQR